MPASLHTHSWYSLLEAVASPAALLERAAACGYTTLALTDTNNLYGAVAFVEQSHRYDIRPLLGACLKQHRSRCVALIAERSGYRSLCRILSRLHLGTTLLAELLTENAEGLHVLVDDRVLAERLREAFGARLWLEVVRPPAGGAGAGHPTRQEQELLACGRRLGVRPVASTAAHFATPADYPTFRLITAVRRLTLLEQLPRLPVTPEHHLVDPDTLRHRFRDLPEAVRNTDLLAEQLRSDVLPHDVILPKARTPRGLDAVRYLHRLCERGLRQRDLGDNLAARQRLREEFVVLEMAGLADYFLVVREIARYARRKGHSMALRGSAGNSLVCFLLRITDVDPLRFGLPMERFLHPGRKDLPDIDLDFDWKVRDDVIDHVFRRHGPRHTARISSHLFLQPRSAFREAAKVHGLSNEQISRLLETLSERIEPLLSRTDWQSVLPAGEELPLAGCPPGFPLEAERWPRLLADARRLVGRPHHLSIHPGGVVITPQPMEDYAPLQMAPKGVVITQFDKDAVEYIGLVKIDLLGNRALATVDEATAHCSADTSPKRKRGVASSLACASGLCLQEAAMIALLQTGDTLGVNQLESPAMRHLLIQMKPAGVNDVIQALAMIRPGAASVGMKECFIRRRRGLEAVRYPHPSLEPLLRETHGLMLYEDDALGVVQALTGLSAVDADRFRKRVTKHRTEQEAEALALEFLQACSRHGVARSVAGELWVQLAKFNHYSFCKSHAVSYGLIAWRAVHLKAHHPLCFWTAALNNNQGMYPRRVYIEAIKRAGIAVYLPCINRSAADFTIERCEKGDRTLDSRGPVPFFAPDGIRTGLGAVASLDEGLRTAILTDRGQRGPYRDLADFRRRVQPGPDTLALLIRCGALDFTDHPRPALFLEADLQDVGRIGNPSHQHGLFAEDLSAGWVPADYTAERRLRDEWELLGFVHGPPLMAQFRPHLSAGLIASRELREHLGKLVRVAGVVATARHTPTAKGDTMQFITLEDEWGLIEVTLFPGVCPPVAYLALGPYLVTGVVEEQYGVVTVTARSFQLYRGPGKA